MIKNKLIQYLLFYIAFVGITIFCMLEFWPSSMRPSSFGYIMFFICFLESLIFLFPSIIKDKQSKGEKSYLVVISGFITLYIIISFFLLILGALLSSYSSSLIYILTIGFTILFGFFIFIYSNLVKSDNLEDAHDDKNRLIKKKINNEFRKMLIKFQDSQGYITDNKLNEIKDQFDIIQNKLLNMKVGTIADEINKVDESISAGINNLNILIDKIDSNNSDDIEKSILNELHILKEHLKFRQELLKV